MSARVALGTAYAALFAAIGVYMPFFPLFLGARGFTPETIGFAVAVPNAVWLVATPAAGILSDRSGDPRRLLVAIGAASVLGLAAVGLAPGIVATVIAIGVSSVFWNPAVPLLESYALRLSASGSVDYGRARLWGSIAFIGANLAAGAALDRWSAAVIVWWIAVPYAAFAAATAMLPSLAVRAPPAVEASVEPPQRQFVLGVGAAALIHASHALLYAFASLRWRNSGIDSTVIGILWSIGVIAEIGFFYAGTQILRRLSPLGLIALGGVAAAFRFATFAVDLPVALIAALQLLHGLSFGSAHLGLMSLISQSAPEHAAGRTQTYSATALGIVMTVASAVTGPLYAQVGSVAFTYFAGLGAAGAILALVAILQGRNVALKPGGRRMFR